jgi:hypothetical protein
MEEETDKKEIGSVLGYARPKTRGELRDLLKDGIKCEVVSSNAEITEVMLRCWLNFKSFTVRQSENPGWSIFEGA